MNDVRNGLAAVLAVACVTSGSAAAAQPAQGDMAPTLTGRIVWTRKPTGEAVSAMRPARVVQDRTPGGAILDCLATAAGTLADCKVASEAPLDYGFGAAALGLAPQHRLAARTETGEPTAGARVRVPVTFNAGRVGGAMTLMGYPIWVEAPSVAEVEAAYPSAGASAAGEAVVRCAFDIEGRTTDCAVQAQTPAGKGFGPAALALADRFVVLHAPDDAEILPGVIVDIPIAFRKPEAAAGRMPEPQWLTEVTAAGVEEFFPIPAREEAVVSGQGKVDCLVTRQGGMTDCRIASEQPEALGFGEAAVKVAQLMRLNPWSPNGRSYAGRRLTVPIRLRLVKPRDPGAAASWGWRLPEAGANRR